jgi:hypothetical protein
LDSDGWPDGLNVEPTVSQPGAKRNGAEAPDCHSATQKILIFKK